MFSDLLSLDSFCWDCLGNSSLFILNLAESKMTLNLRCPPSIRFCTGKIYKFVLIFLVQNIITGGWGGPS